MRSIKELLELMLDNQEVFEDGLCLWSRLLFCKGKITLNEVTLIEDYIRKNPPSIFSSFDALMHATSTSAYYWKRNDIKPRIKWIKKHIKLNS